MQCLVVHYLAVFVYLSYVPGDYFVLILHILKIHVVAHYRTRGRTEESRYRRGEQQCAHSHAAARRLNADLFERLGLYARGKLRIGCAECDIFRAAVAAQLGYFKLHCRTPSPQDNI